MTTEQIANSLKDHLQDRIQAVFAEDRHPRIHIHAKDWRMAAEFLRNDPSLQMDWLANLSGVDYAADGLLAVVYDLWSFRWRHAFAVKIFIPRDDPHIASVVDLWAAANWHEREAFDLLGIIFDGHPDLRRILCAEDWVGYPLRKDYVFPREYHGIPASVELDWQQQADYPHGHG
jgi:NADH-quinone oxidoreductase subunit C